MDFSGVQTDHRRFYDRRRRPTHFWNRYLFHGRRKGYRRRGEPENDYYVDRFGSGEWVGIALLLALCGSDALMTYLHLGYGAVEANPLLRYFYHAGGIGGLLAAKGVLTLPGALFLLIHSKFTFFPYAVAGVVAIYAMVLTYQAWLFL